jgi:hypothetical protein
MSVILPHKNFIISLWHVRFEVLTAVKMSILVFWTVTPYELYVDNVSEEHTVFIFKAYLNTVFQIYLFPMIN